LIHFYKRLPCLSPRQAVAQSQLTTHQPAFEENPE